jgi:pimeloyl-ACP methyl ester carboxylesterase
VLRAQGAETVSAVGFSTGSLVLLRLANQQPDLFDRVVAIAPPLRLVSPRRYLLQVARALNVLVGSTLGRLYAPLYDGLIPWHAMHTLYPAEQYDRVPLHAVALLKRLASRVKAEVALLKGPVHLVHGTADPVAALDATRTYARHLGERGRLHVLEGAGHDVVRINTVHSWARIILALEEKIHANSSA